MSIAPIAHDVSDIEGGVQAAIEALMNREAKNVYLSACGGSYALMIPIQTILQSNAQGLEAHALNARELTTRKPTTLGKDSIVLLCSHSGMTPETVEAATYAREHGALMIALTHDPESPLAKAAEYVVIYQHGDGKDFGYTAAPLLYRLVRALIDKANGTNDLDRATEAVSELDRIVRAEQEKVAKTADEWGKKHARSEIVYTLSSGANYGVGYSFAICLLQEMLWVHSQGINAAEYFHGPFEITDFDVPFLSMVGIGDARVIDERALTFARSKSQDVTVLDAQGWDLSAVPEQLRGEYAHLVFGPVIRCFADALADHKGHPLSVRRYMWRMEY